MWSSRRSIATISTTAGQRHFAAVIRAIRARCPETTIEVLTPDFLRKEGAVETVVAAPPDVFNHNLETVPSLYLTIRPGARYFVSLRLLAAGEGDRPGDVHQVRASWSGWARAEEIMQVMDDLRAANVDFLTIGQYLQPTRKHPRWSASGRPMSSRPRDRRLRKGLPDGLGHAADALVVPCRR